MIDFSGALTTQRVTVTPPRFVGEEIQSISVERAWRKDLVDDALGSSMERNPLLTGSNGSESERALNAFGAPGCLQRHGWPERETRSV